MTIDADVLVVGGGIAGRSAAWFASHAGHRVTVVDAGRHCASRVPVAMLNPLRGREGRVVPRGIVGMGATFALIDALGPARRHLVVARGVLRPVVDASPERRERTSWISRLPSTLAWSWHERVPNDAGLRIDAPAIELHDAGAVDANAMLDALRATCAARWIEGEVVDLVHDGDAHHATLMDGRRIAAGRMLWCGGAWGAARIDAARRRRGVSGHEDERNAVYRPGSVAVFASTSRSGPKRTLACGLYAAPLGSARFVFGPTHEASRARHAGCRAPRDGRIDASRVSSLRERAARWFGDPGAPLDGWRGVRLERLSSGTTATLAGIPTLTALGSRGFLLAPLLAREWAARL